jgi:hypothetical protein
MSLKLIKNIQHTITNGDVLIAKVYRDSDWQQYIVKTLTNGKLAPEAQWYYCDDREDAINTAYAMINLTPLAD